VGQVRPESVSRGFARRSDKQPDALHRVIVSALATLDLFPLGTFACGNAKSGTELCCARTQERPHRSRTTDQDDQLTPSHAPLPRGSKTGIFNLAHEPELGTRIDRAGGFGSRTTLAVMSVLGLLYPQETDSRRTIEARRKGANCGSRSNYSIASSVQTRQHGLIPERLPCAWPSSNLLRSSGRRRTMRDGPRASRRGEHRSAHVASGRSDRETGVVVRCC
jgi:hypothetical protein